MPNLPASIFSPEHLRGKVALITGGGTGIGKEIARTLAAHGARIIICSRKIDVLDATAKELRAEGAQCLTMACDIREPEAVEAVVAKCIEEFDQLDILVNNAAGNFPARIEDLSYNAFKTVVDIDLQGTFNMTKAAFTLAMRKNGGVVINIAAPFEHLGVAWQAHAAAAKSGVISLTRSAAVEWANLGIRVNAVSPGGIVDTTGLDKMVAPLTSNNKAARYGTRQDIANAVMFLASDAARFISGVNLCVDGGTSVDMLKIPIYEDE
ncbi:MAG: peroxisomal 2,4-dienoyl-CoA reductase [Halioglobus sp.]|jgi:peroxisomal 2,4-dienoyl-CoA reductase